MAINREHIKIGIIALVAIAAVIFIVNIFSGSKKPDEKLYDKLMEVYQSQVDDLRERVNSEVEVRRELQAEYDQYLRNDSLLRDQLLKNQVKYIPINKGYAEIPDRINSISGDDAAIRNAFAKY